MSSQNACKTIGHAIALAHSGDSIMVAAATYTEHLTIGISLNVIGSSVSPTIIDGGRAATVVTIPNTSTSVILSSMTIRNGQAVDFGGVYNSGTLTINNSTISGNGAWGPGGGIDGPATLQNSIVANSFNGGNCSGNAGSTVRTGFLARVVGEGLACRVRNCGWLLPGSPGDGPRRAQAGPAG